MAKAKSRKKAAPAHHGAAEALRSAWGQAQEALATAQAAAEKQVKAALKRNKIGGREAAVVLKELGARFERERKKAQKRVEAQLATLRSRVTKEGRAAGRRVGEAVEQALAALNIPSRREVADLTRKVGELSKKIDALKRRK
ncbi:MAG TPA: phasin family protein [Vicinamibacteria bacterium]|nr:phasin family protein [Vicinamibacteria bacterium]